ncbi:MULTISPECIES: hypothetical protein [unclassified Leptolyngbya]|uniref:hypothetical protein n=1 Tax=unclassified Leptolyngbya TaxID=2650499 RepID=UPI0016832610|nr:MULTISPECIES: hypothetical protein [unclassified Leptolyngbya]MBD1913626.1 hypothetical protein [Leptolyngbya sp. FACHB-8]MBD2154043.1 hypothetical protein [Leptolyngbya sp. FACHB-16]
MEDLMWLIVLPPAAREAVGYVDFDLILSDTPRLPNDDAYMRGWNEAKEISITTQFRKRQISCDQEVSIDGGN